MLIAIAIALIAFALFAKFLDTIDETFFDTLITAARYRWRNRLPRLTPHEASALREARRQWFDRSGPYGHFTEWEDARLAFLHELRINRIRDTLPKAS